MGAMQLDGWRVKEYGRSRDGLPLRVFLPGRAVRGLLTAGQHGEEADTTLLARRLLERVGAADTAWAIVPCLNPDGLVAGTRQNAAGVDLNRNFPSSSWSPRPSYTYPPGIAPELRVEGNRTNRSSTGASAASEPETQAVMALVERLRPEVVVDLHSPLELVLARPSAPRSVVELLASTAGLPIEEELAAACPGSFDEWLTERGVAAVVYEIEHAGLPALCARHLPGLEALLRGPAR
jgi:protein MpaA